MVIHVFKDGTTKESLNDAIVPKEIVTRVAAIASRKAKKDEKKNN